MERSIKRLMAKGGKKRVLKKSREHGGWVA